MKTSKYSTCCTPRAKYVIYDYLVIDRVAGAIIRFVASVCVSVRLSVGALLFEPFDL